MMFGKSGNAIDVLVVHNDLDAPWPIRPRNPSVNRTSEFVPDKVVERRRPVEPVLIVSSPDHADRHNRPRTMKLVSMEWLWRRGHGRAICAEIFECDHERKGSRRNHGRKPRSFRDFG